MKANAIKISFTSVFCLLSAFCSPGNAQLVNGRYYSRKPLDMIQLLRVMNNKNIMINGIGKPSEACSGQGWIVTIWYDLPDNYHGEAINATNSTCFGSFKCPGQPEIGCTGVYTTPTTFTQVDQKTIRANSSLWDGDKLWYYYEPDFKANKRQLHRAGQKFDMRILRTVRNVRKAVLTKIH